MLQTCCGGQWIAALNSSNNTRYCASCTHHHDDGRPGILFNHSVECATLLPTAIMNPNSLANEMASMRPVELIFMGDSILEQIVIPLQWAARLKSFENKVSIVQCSSQSTKGRHHERVPKLR